MRKDTVPLVCRVFLTILLSSFLAHLVSEAQRLPTIFSSNDGVAVVAFVPFRRLIVIQKLILKTVST